MILVYRYRVKNLEGSLEAQARAVNFVWNYCNDVQRHAVKWDRRWPTNFDLHKLTAGTYKDLGLAAMTINAVCDGYARSAKRRTVLRYRGLRSLGWIPVKAQSLKRVGNAFRFYGRTFRVFDPRALPGKIKDGSSFSRDACGHWFLNVAVEVAEDRPRVPVNGIGIDLGLKDFAGLSTGEKIANPRHYARIEARLAMAQRARKRRLAASLHAKAANARRDALHKLSHRLVREYDFIAVGNVNAAGLSKTSMGKSVQDASWTTFRDMLRYKAIARGAWYEEVNEAFSSQVCSSCGSLPDSRPRGIADLGIRQWTCSDCGAQHDRDTNAAINILARHGHVSPAVGTPALIAA